MSLLSYLPKVEEVNRCIKPEAEGAHEAVLLAVHQPTPLSFRRFNSSVRQPTTESALLEHLLTRNVPTGALVVPITGTSGVGKSHLVRMIDARLRRSASGSRYVIVRIPKSASLRRVVELILELLPDAKYQPVKAAFRNAVSEVNLESAAIRFQGELEIALKEKAQQVLELARQGPTEALKEQLDHARRLPLLLTDPVIAPFFREHVFPRIVRRAVAGSQDGGPDINEGQFVTGDLDLPETIDLGQAAQPASRYYLTAIQAREGRGRAVATDLLNLVVDQATRQLFNLQDALGGMTLQDVILEVRKLLLRDEKELVLLVEDFAALTGIQETLAKVLIQEGVRDGVTQLATLRSVIAVTDGYLLNRDTLATRAMYEWVVESRISSEAETLALARKLVASYINAARWGEEQLVERYERRHGIDEGDKDWLPTFEGDEGASSRRLLDGFGYEEGIPLFPYNRAAIDHLTRRALIQGDALVFNPRFIINDVLRRVLLPGRSAFEGRQFPPFIVDTTPSADVAQWLASLGSGSETRERYERVAVIWGNNPEVRGDVAHISPEVFESFGLERPDLEPAAPRDQPTPTTAPTPVPRPTLDPSTAEAQQVHDVRLALEQWVQGTTLPQPIAAAIRKTLSLAINEQIDWNAERMLKTPIEAKQISIPSAGGQGGVSERSILVAKDSSDPDGRLRSEVLSLYRLRSIFEDRSEYEEFEEDLARVANLTSRLLPQALALVQAENVRQCQLALVALRTNSMALGIKVRTKSTRSLRQSLLADPPSVELLPAEAPNVFKEWKSLQSEIFRFRARLKELVVATSGCYQGTGEKPHAIDLVRLVEIFPTPEFRLEVAAISRLSADERQLLANMADSRLAPRVRALALEWQRLRASVLDRIGAEFDKSELTTAVKELAEKMKSLGAWSAAEIGCTHPEAMRAIEDFRTSAVKECLEQVPPFWSVSSSDDDAEQDMPGGRVGITILPALIADRFAHISSALIDSAGRHAQMSEHQSGGITLEDQQNLIKQSFGNLLETFDQLEHGGRHGNA